MLSRSKNIIITVIDFFYPLFRRVLPLQTYRYLACGGSNALLNLLLFFIAHNFIFTSSEVVYIGPIAMNDYIASFAFALSITFPVGFILNKYVVFQTSHLRGRVQLFRYGLLTAINIFLNWALLHFFAGYCGFWATPSQALTTALLAILSYFAQNYFSFRSKKKLSPIEVTSRSADMAEINQQSES